MDFFGRPTFQRNSYFDPWVSQPRVFYPQEQFYTPWSRQARRQVFIDPEDYYDPIFGEKKKSDESCNCRDCRIRAVVQQRKKQQLRRNALKKRQRQPTQEENTNDVNTALEEASETSPQNLIQEPANSTDVNHESDDVEQRLQDIDIQSEAENQSDVEQERSQESEDNESESESSSESEEENQEDEKETNSPESTQEDPIQRKLKTIDEIQSEVEKLDQKVAQITNESKKYDYLYCEEMLTKCLLKLDDILAEGEDVIRTARKRLVNDINRALTSLEEKREELE